MRPIALLRPVTIIVCRPPVLARLPTPLFITQVFQGLMYVDILRPEEYDRLHALSPSHPMPTLVPTSNGGNTAARPPK
jgi:hypothetical protein